MIETSVGMPTPTPRTLQYAHEILDMKSDDQVYKMMTGLVRYIDTQHSAQDYDFAINPEHRLAKVNRALSPYTITATVTHSLSSSRDHLISLSALLDKASIQPVFGGFTLIRAALEAQCQAAYLLGSHSSGIMKERSIRSAIANIRDSDNIKQTLGSNSTFERDYAALSTVATRNGIDIEDYKKRGPTYTTVVKTADIELDCQAALFSSWQIASGMAHGRHWAIRALTRSNEILDASNEYGAAHEIKSDARALNYLLSVACDAHEATVRLYKLRANGDRSDQEKLFIESHRHVNSFIDSV